MVAINWEADQKSSKGRELATDVQLQIERVAQSKHEGKGPGFVFAGLKGYWNTRKSDFKGSPDIPNAKKGDTVKVTLARVPKEDDDGYWQDVTMLEIVGAATAPSPNGATPAYTPPSSDPAAFRVKDAQIMRQSGVKSLVELAGALLSTNIETQSSIIFKVKRRNAEMDKVAEEEVDFGTYAAWIVEDARKAVVNLIVDAVALEAEAAKHLRPLGPTPKAETMDEQSE